jgi:hypothetical protein
VELTGSGHRIHKADNAWIVGVNIREWNRQVALPQDMAQAFRTWHSPVASLVPIRAAGVVLLPPRR